VGNFEAEPTVTLSVRVTPRADRNALAGVRDDGTVLIRVTAAPTDGQANKAVLATLADALKLKKSQVSLVSGETSRDKRIQICGLSAAEVQSRLLK
jgi:uncharacterized protein